MSFWNKKIFHTEPDVFALEVSDASIKVLELEADGKKDFIRGFADFNLPAGIVEEGRIIKKDQLSEAILKTISSVRHRKIKTKKVVCSLPESKVFLRIISIPKMAEDEAEEAVKWEMEANIPLAIEQVYYDWQFLGSPKDGKQDILTVAVAREVVDDFIEVLGKAGLEPYGFEAETIANIRSLVPITDNIGQPSLIIDLGSKKTSFIIQKDGVPFFTSSVPFSSLGLDDTISKSLNLGFKEAEKVKINAGIINRENNPLFNALLPTLESLSSEIEKTMDFSSVLAKDSGMIDEIVLIGGGANLKGLPEYLSERLKKDVKIGDPLINLRINQKKVLISKEQALRYATVIGLALRSIRYGY